MINNDLFVLVHSLTKNEKGYFKKYAKLNASKNKPDYVKLYEIISGLKSIDDKSVVKKLKFHRLNNHLPVLNTYLKNQVLSAMRLYRNETSIEGKIRDALMNIEFLYEKGLFSQCFKWVEKAKSWSQEFEYHHYLLETIKWEARLILAKNDLKGLKFMIENELPIARRCIRDIQEIHIYRTSAYKAIWEFKKAGAIVSSEKFIGNTLNALHQKPPGRLHSFMGKVYYLQSSYFLFMAGGEYEKAFQKISELIDFIESDQRKIQEDPNLYFGLVQNMIAICLFLEKYELAIEFVEKKIISMESFGATYMENQMNRYALALNSKLYAYIMLKNLKDGRNLAKTLPEIAEDNRLTNESQLIMRFTLMRFFILDGSPGKSLQISSKIINTGEPKERKDYYWFARLIHLCIHFELGNKRVLQNGVKSYRRNILKQRKLFQVESLLLSFFARMESFRNDSEQLKAMHKLANELVSLRSNKVEQTMYKYHDFDAWMTGRVAVLKEKLQV